MAGKKNKPRRRRSATLVEHVSPGTAPLEPATPTSPPSSLLPQTRETPPGAVTPLISSSSPSSTHQERLPANPFLDLSSLSSAVVSQFGPQEATQPPTKQSPALPPPPNAAPVKRAAGSKDSVQEEDWFWVPGASFAGPTAAGLGEKDAYKVLERSMRFKRSTIKKMQRMAKKRKERAALEEELSKNRRSIEEIFRAVNECSTESDDGSSCGGEVCGGNDGDGGDGGDRCDRVASVMREWIRLVLALWFIFGVLVAWVVWSRFQM